MKTDKILSNNFIRRLLEKMAAEESEEKLKEYEFNLMAYILGLMFIFASFYMSVVGYLWKIDTIKIIWVAIQSFLSGHIFLKAIKWKIKVDYKYHIICSILSILLLAIHIVFYARIRLMYWILFLIIILPSMVSKSKILFYYLVPLLGVCLYIGSTFKSDVTILIDNVYNITSIVLMTILGITFFMIKRIFVKLSEIKNSQFRDILHQKEEITSLYEEVFASEEELRSLNEDLTASEEELRSLNEELTASEEELRSLNEELTIRGTELEKKNIELRNVAYIDSLTKLYNRSYMQYHIQNSISNNKNDQFSLAYIDLDNFKKTNDMYGHKTGDKLLVELSKKISDIIHKDDIVCRLGGDEFAIIINRALDDKQIDEYINSILDGINVQYIIDDHDLFITSSIGIATYPFDASNDVELLKIVNMAMYKAKSLGKNNYFHYEQTLKDERMRRIEMENILSKALENNELYFNFQPMISTACQTVFGFEALMRWNSPILGIIPPLTFIPIMEDMGIIQDIGFWGIETVCEKINFIKKQYNKDMSIFVNLSALQFKSPNFVSRVKDLIQKTGVNAKCLIFEITESLFIDNIDNAKLIIDELKSVGIRFAIDDFGTGFSSLSQLVDLPIDILKIDKSFIDRIMDKEVDADEFRRQNLIPVIIDIAHKLKMSVVGEGVEIIEQIESLIVNKCDIIQGYYYSKPLPEDKMESFILIDKV